MYIRWNWILLRVNRYIEYKKEWNAINVRRNFKFGLIQHPSINHSRWQKSTGSKRNDQPQYSSPQDKTWIYYNHLDFKLNFCDSSNISGQWLGTAIIRYNLTRLVHRIYCCCFCCMQPSEGELIRFKIIRV